MRSSGYSLLETTVVLSVLITVAAIATPSLLAARDDARARSAANYLASLLHLARLEAVKRQANVALRFEDEGSDVRLTLYADGNGNGVRTLDIEAGVDGVIRPAEGIGQQSPGVRFAMADGIPDVDGDRSGGRDPVRVGRSGMVSFSPVGTSSSGTAYLLGRGRRQFAVRVLGPTARIRVFEYHFPSGEWRER